MDGKWRAHFLTGVGCPDGAVAFGGGMKTILVRFGVVAILSLVGVGLAHADALHGFCTSPTPTCSDSGAITPVASSDPTFGFWDASGPITGTDLLVFLSPTNTGSNSLSFSV